MLLTLAVLCTAATIHFGRKRRHQREHVFDHLLLVGFPEYVVNPFDLNVVTSEVFHQKVDIEPGEAVLVFDHHLVNRLVFHQPEQLLEFRSGVAHPGTNLIIRLDDLILLLAGVGDEPSHLPV